MAENKTASSKKTKELQKVNHDNIYSALSAFQGEMKAIEKDGVVDYTTRNGERVKFRYSTLGLTVETIKHLLKRHGLSFRHFLSPEGIECFVMHETTGKGLLDVPISSGLLPLNFNKSDIKEVGAQITYGRRYTLGLALGIVTEEDKDASLITEKLNKVQNYAFQTSKNGIDRAKTVEEVEKGIAIMQKEIARLEKGEKTTFGLEKNQYEEIIQYGREKIKNLSNTATNDNTQKEVEQ